MVSTQMKVILIKGVWGFFGFLFFMLQKVVLIAVIYSASIKVENSWIALVFVSVSLFLYSSLNDGKRWQGLRKKEKKHFSNVLSV